MREAPKCFYKRERKRYICVRKILFTYLKKYLNKLWKDYRPSYFEISFDLCFPRNCIFHFSLIPENPICIRISLSRHTCIEITLRLRVAYSEVLESRFGLRYVSRKICWRSDRSDSDQSRGARLSTTVDGNNCHQFEDFS